jgi:hypothetical protein
MREDAVTNRMRLALRVLAINLGYGSQLVSLNQIEVGSNSESILAHQIDGKHR